MNAREDKHVNECGGSFDPVRASEIYIEEHKTRLKYQGLTYLVCAEIDAALGRHMSLGTGTIATEESLMMGIRTIAANSKSAEWATTTRRKEAQDAILAMRFLAAHSPDPLAASTAESVALVLEWAIGGKNDEFEAMLRQTKAEIDAA